MKNCVLIVGMICIQMTIYAQIPEEDLILYMPFNGNALDESGNLNNGSINGASLTTDRFGHDDSAYYFDGIDDYITISNNNLNPTSDVTFSFWFSPTEDWTASSDHQIFFQSDIAGDTSGDFIISFNRTNCWSFPSTDDGKVNFELQGDFENNNSIDCSAYGLTRVSSTTDTWDSNQWYNVSLIIDGGVMKIYVNGVLENTYVTNSSLFVENQLVHIGRYFSPQHLSAFNGKIDDIRVYHSALNEEEIISIYEEFTTGYNTINKELVFKVQPIPTSNYLIIDVEDSSLKYKVKILDIIGQVVLETDMNQSEIELNPTIPRGTYFVQFYGANNVLLQIEKIIKQ